MFNLYNNLQTAAAAQAAHQAARAAQAAQAVAASAVGATPQPLSIPSSSSSMGLIAGTEGNNVDSPQNRSVFPNSHYDAQ